jgi:hypothetical protein
MKEEDVYVIDPFEDSSGDGGYVDVDDDRVIVGFETSSIMGFNAEAARDFIALLTHAVEWLEGQNKKAAEEEKTDG